jgi:pimeloyl-ACP methyl ester carboxylesterase
MPKINNIVLVHGGFVDGAGWRGVFDLLKKAGYDVSVVQNSTQSLASDVASTRQVIEAQDGPVILVGHSYGGAVITEAGTHPKVAGLVYVTAFAPDKGESVSSLIANPVPGYDPPPIVPSAGGYLLLDKTKFAAAFAGDVDADTAGSMAEAQVPWGAEALSGVVSDPAWKSRPSWYLQVRDDKMIPRPAQEFMARRAGATVVEVPGSHAIYVSNPRAVADIVQQAATSVKLAEA